MKKMKVLALLMISSLLIGNSSVPALAEGSTMLTYEQQIMEQVEEMTGFETEDAEIVTVSNGNSLSRSTTVEKAIKITQDDGVVIIVPKITNANNDVVNSFSYAETKPMSRSTSFEVTHLVDMTINFSCFYNQEYFWEEGVTLYTPKSIYFSWNSDESSAKVDEIEVTFDANGDYWKIDPLTDLGYEKYVSFEVSKTNPKEGISYGDWGDAMNDNYGIACTNYFDHGGNIWYSLEYTVNGVTRYDTYSWTLFGK